MSAGCCEIDFVVNRASTRRSARRAVKARARFVMMFEPARLPVKIQRFVTHKDAPSVVKFWWADEIGGGLSHFSGEPDCAVIGGYSDDRTWDHSYATARGASGATCGGPRAFRWARRWLYERVQDSCVRRARHRDSGVGQARQVRTGPLLASKPVTRANVLRSEIIRSRETGVYAGYSARRPDAVFHSTMFDEVMDEFAAKVAGLTDGDVWHACLRQLRRAAPPRPLPGQGAREFAWEERVPTIIGAAPHAVFPISDGCGRQVGAQASPGPSPSFWLAPDDHHRIIEQLPV